MAPRNNITGFSAGESSERGGGQGTSALFRNNTGNLAGRWRVASPGGVPALQLQMSNGESAQFQLSTDGRRTFLDGVRVMVVENTVCPYSVAFLRS